MKCGPYYELVGQSNRLEPHPKMPVQATDFLIHEPINLATLREPSTGRIMACISWAWVGNPADCEQAELGEPTDGPVLYIFNYVRLTPDRHTLWKLKRLVPKARFTVWYHGEEFHAPKGVPTSWFGC